MPESVYLRKSSHCHVHCPHYYIVTRAVRVADEGLGSGLISQGCVHVSRLRHKAVLVAYGPKGRGTAMQVIGFISSAV